MQCARMALLGVSRLGAISLSSRVELWRILGPPIFGPTAVQALSFGGDCEKYSSPLISRSGKRAENLCNKMFNCRFVWSASAGQLPRSRFREIHYGSALFTLIQRARSIFASVDPGARHCRSPKWSFDNQRRRSPFSGVPFPVSKGSASMHRLIRAATRGVMEILGLVPCQS